MKRMKLFFTAVALFASVLAFAQNITVSGTVSDTNGETVPYASIQLKGTMTGTASDGNGQYSITVPSNGVLVFSSIGYTTQEVSVGGKSVVNCVLVPDSEYLNDVIVVAYGTSTKATFTGSSSVVKSETIEKRQVSNVSNALAGTVAGVQATSANGQPGVSAKIRIRGFGSINAGMDPLYVLDGVPYDGDISAINTQDIESMTVLKDAAAAALYGARGANGVIMITTKKGASGEAKISFDARVGVNSRAVKNYDVMTSPAEYTEKLYEAYYNAATIGTMSYTPDEAFKYANSNLVKATGYNIYTIPAGQYLIGSNGKLNPNATLGYSDGKNFFTPDNWAKETFSNQTRQEYNMSISGGNDKISYYMSGGYLTDGGVIAHSGFDRLTTRATVDYQAKDWLKVGTNLAYTNSSSYYPDEQQTTSSSGNAFFIANFIAPTIPMYVRDAEGKLLHNGNNPVFDYGDGKSTASKRNWMSISNPLGDLIYQTQEYLADILNAKWYATITPVEGLAITANLGYMVDNTRFHLASSSMYGQASNYGGEAEQVEDHYQGFTQQYIANYKKSFGLNNFDLTLAYEAYRYYTEEFYAYGQNLYKEGVWAVDNAIDQLSGGGSTNDYVTKGIISRLNYDFDEKYFVSLSYRRDASSRFAPEKRWGNFWSASAAWNVASEDFMSDATWVNLLKLKASFGQQGNDDIHDTEGYSNYYAYLDQYKMTGAEGVFSDAALKFKGNPDLTWETTNAFNAGVDFDFWNEKLAGSIEYFNRTATNMLYNKPTPPSNGYSSIPMNVGSMANYGVELDLTSNLVNNSNFRWDINFNSTWLRNKILKLSPDLGGQLIDGSNIYKEGDSRYQLYMVKYAGINPNNGAPLYWAKSKADDKGALPKDFEGKEVAEGQEYKTPNYTVADATNKAPTGDVAPKISGGFGTSLVWGGFDFSLQLSYQLGGRLYDNGYSRLMHAGDTSYSGQNWHKDIAKAWTPTNTNTDVPRVCSTDKYTNSMSTRFLVSSDYLSLNNITLGYTLPSTLTQKVGIEALRIYVSGDNIGVLAARKGLDPRQGVTSATTARYTALRTVSGGVKLTF